MATETTRDARVVVGIDGSPGGDAALREAVHEAIMRDASLDVVHVWSLPYGAATPYGAIAVRVDAKACERAAQAMLDDHISGALNRVEERPRRVERILVEDHSASRVLVNTAMNADLLVVGSRGHSGFSSLSLGSVSQQCAHHAPCPVLIVRRH